MFQNPNDQLFSLSVRDDIAFGPLNKYLGIDVYKMDSDIQGVSAIFLCN